MCPGWREAPDGDRPSLPNAVGRGEISGITLIISLDGSPYLGAFGLAGLLDTNIQIALMTTPPMTLAALNSSASESCRPDDDASNSRVQVSDSFR
jgi:hypothetical protein